MITIEGVPAERLQTYWPYIEARVAEAVTDAAQPWTADDVRTRIAAGTMQLWVVWREGRISTVMATEVYDTGRGMTCAIPVVQGDMADVEALDTIEAWASEMGCTRLQGEGRLGWARALRGRGWRPISMQVEKVIHGQL